MKKIIYTSICALLFFSGCKKAEITGRVVDGFGNPLEGATVTVTGTQFTSRTDTEGGYSVPYVPGELSLSYAKPGHIPKTTNLTIATEAEYPAEKITLYQSIPGQGIYAFHNGTYEPLAQGTLQMNTREHTFSWSGPLVTTNYFAQGNFTRLNLDDAVRFIENVSVSKNMMLVKLQARDRIMTRIKYFTGNPKDEYASVAFRPAPLEEATTLLEMQRSPFGKYAFVPFGTSMGNLGHPIKNPIYLFTILPEADCADCDKFIGQWQTGDGSQNLVFSKMEDIYRCIGNGIEQDSQMDFCHISQNGSAYWLSCSYGKSKNGVTGNSFQMEYLSEGKIRVHNTEYALAVK